MRTHGTQVQSGTRKSLRPRRGGVAPERDGVGETEQTILEVVDRGGLHINEHELRYQLARRQIDSVGVLERMRDLEQRGLVECAALLEPGQPRFEEIVQPRQGGVRAKGGDAVTPRLTQRRGARGVLNRLRGTAQNIHAGDFPGPP